MSLSSLFLKKYGPGPLTRSFSSPFISLVERRITNSSAEIRKNPDWISLIDNEKERTRWSEMVAEELGTTPTDMEYIFEELAYYKTLQENCQGTVVLGGADMVWVSDVPDDNQLLREVKHYAAILEAHPKQKMELKDNTTLMLIDPLLYPLDYELSHLLPSPIESPATALRVSTFGDRPGSFEAWSKVVAELNKDIKTDDNIYTDCDQGNGFCWLPTDIRVNADGSVHIKSYINNLHPTQHSFFYATLSKVLERTIPLFEQVLTDLVHPTNVRVPVVDDDCVDYTAPHPDDVDWDEIDLDVEEDDIREAWEQGIIYTEPVPGAFVEPDRPLVPYSLRGEGLQVVVEMKNMHLTPENPEYKPFRWNRVNRWQNSGIPNDNIVATSIWYYDIDNMDISDIEFRDPVGEYKEIDYINDALDKKVFSYVYGESNDTSKGFGYEQVAGSTEIKSGRVVCFPNSYQHLRSSVKLADPSKPGHVKMLLFHFVHPGVRLPSTSIVAPQQQDWWIKDAFATSPLKGLPQELCHMIQQKVNMPMSLEKAREKYLDSGGLHLRYESEFKSYSTYIA
ncbi:hypothetical protein EV179_001302 [Coemansia sp. RSA 487]|nr:hypothetical protein EV179_001302 [Coemansia sp. RSA 487]